MKKFMLLTLLLVVGVSASIAQKKAVSEAKNAATQEKPDYKTAETLIKQALVNDETKNDAKTWNTAGFIFNKKFEDERNKDLIKQPCDKPMMYESLLEAYNYWLKCIEVDNMPNEKGKVKPKFTEEIRTKLKEISPEFINAGAYFYDLKDYKLAYKYFNQYNQASATEALKGLGIGEDPNMQMIPFYACLAALNMENDSVAVSALEFAKKKDYEKYKVYYFLADTYKKNNQTEKYNATLREGYSLFADSLYFIGNLINNYISAKDYTNATTFLNEAISRKPNENLYIALGEVYQESGKSEAEIKAVFEDAIKVNPNAHLAYFYIGRLSFNKAVEVANKSIDIKDNKKYQASKEETNKLYKEALPWFLKAVEISPESMEYLIPLRSIYYNLTMNKEFDALDKKISALRNK
ncbi:MAG: hypothetical protein PHV20_02855 [Bacteroidales bacterium]|nr:hypothetical protein [Bacteroidales bacterium]